MIYHFKIEQILVDFPFQNIHKKIYILFFTNMKIIFIETTYHYEANICAMRQRKQMSVIDTHDWY